MWPRTAPWLLLCLLVPARAALADDAQDLARLRDVDAPTTERVVAELLKAPFKLKLGDTLRRRASSIVRHVSERVLPALARGVRERCANPEDCRLLATQLRAVELDQDNALERVAHSHDPKTGTLRYVVSEHGLISSASHDFDMLTRRMLTAARGDALKSARIGAITQQSIGEIVDAFERQVPADITVARLLAMRRLAPETLLPAVDGAIAKIVAADTTGYLGSPEAEPLSAWVKSLLQSTEIDGALKRGVMERVAQDDARAGAEARAVLRRRYPRQLLGFSALARPELRDAVFGSRWFFEECGAFPACAARALDVVFGDGFTDQERARLFVDLASPHADSFWVMLAEKIEAQPAGGQLPARVAAAFELCPLGGGCGLAEPARRALYRACWRRTALQESDDAVSITMLANLDLDALKNVYPVLRKDQRRRISPAVFTELARKHAATLLKLEPEVREFLAWAGYTGPALARAFTALLEIAIPEAGSRQTALLLSFVDAADKQQRATMGKAFDAWVKRGEVVAFDLRRVSARIDSLVEPVRAPRGGAHPSDRSSPSPRTSPNPGSSPSSRPPSTSNTPIRDLKEPVFGN